MNTTTNHNQPQPTMTRLIIVKFACYAIYF